MRSRPVAAAVAALLVLLAGCTEQTPGDPSAGGEPTGATEQSSESPSTDEPTSTSEDGGGEVADLKPCDILQPADLQELKLTGGEEKEVAGIHTCRYRYEGATLEDTFNLGVDLFPDQGLTQLNADNVKPLPKIGDHEAASWTDPAGACGVSLGVTESSRIDNSAIGGTNQQLACQLAQQLATAVERRLP